MRLGFRLEFRVGDSFVVLALHDAALAMVESTLVVLMALGLVVAVAAALRSRKSDNSIELNR